MRERLRERKIVMLCLTVLMLHVIYFISKFDIITETWFSDYEKCIVLPFYILYLKTVIEL